MGRHAETPGKPKTEAILLRLTPEGLAHIDRQRGDWTRQQYVRAALAHAKDLKGPR